MMTVTLVPQHNSVAMAWQDLGLSEHLGQAEGVTPELILDRIRHWMEREQELEHRGVGAQKLIDGRGKYRLLERISKQLFQKKPAIANA